MAAAMDGRDAEDFPDPPEDLLRPAPDATSSSTSSSSTASTTEPPTSTTTPATGATDDHHDAILVPGTTTTTAPATTTTLDRRGHRRRRGGGSGPALGSLQRRRGGDLAGVAGPSWMTWPSRRAMQRSTRSTKVGSWVATMRAAPSAWSSSRIVSSALLARGVEADEGLVDEQQLEGPDQAERDRRALAEAAAEAGRQVVGAVAEAEPVEQLVEVGLVDRHPVQRGDVGEVLAHGQVVVEHRVVGEVAHRRPRRRGAGRLAERR